jgi:hypothetical protein
LEPAHLRPLSPTAANRSSRLADTPLPAAARNLKFELRGGGIADYSDTCYFETSPAEVDRLIREIGLVEDEFYMPSSHRFRKLLERRGELSTRTGSRTSMAGGHRTMPREPKGAEKRTIPELADVTPALLDVPA